MCNQTKTSQDGRDTGSHSSRRNESMEKTHNPHYKGFGVSFYDTCDWRTIMHSLIPSTSHQPVFWRLNLCSNNGISRSKQEHVRSLSLSLTLAVLITFHQAPVWQTTTCMDQYMEKKSRIYVNALEWDISLSLDVVLQDWICSQLSAFIILCFGFYGHRLFETLLVRVIRPSVRVLLCFKVEEEWRDWQQ